MKYATALGCAWLTLLGCLAVAPAAPGHREARVSVPVASVYAAPSQTAERVTQALLWERVLVVKQQGPWSRVLLPDQYRTPQGYPGWMLTQHLSLDTARSFVQVVTVQSPRAEIRVRPEAGAAVAAVAYFSSDLPWTRCENGWYEVKVPGRVALGWVRAADVVDGYLPATGESVVATASRLKGTPYLWGGMCRLGIDCSGFVYTVYKLHGYLLPRDADQQYQVGTAVDRQSLQPGDLVFFGSGPERITHVGIYVGDDQFIDASGRKGVALSRLVDDRVVDAYVGARRIFP